MWLGGVHRLEYRAGGVVVASIAILLGSGGVSFSQAPLPVVSVISVPVSDISPSTEFIGRVEALNAVDVRARVDGFLEKRLFTEGQAVREGESLFVMEEAALQIAIAAARARMASAQASFQEAESRLQRNQRLRQTDVVAQATLEEATAARDTSRAAVSLAEADLQQAELNLGYATIKSPIAGRIGRANFAVGSLIDPASSALARVVQVDPVRVVFSVSDRAILQLRAGAMDLSPEELAKLFTPVLRMSSGEDYAGVGTIEFVGNEFDARTGTIPIWARFENSRSILVPGQFVTVVVRKKDTSQRPMVPVKAVEQDREGRFVLLVDEADKIVLRRIQVGRQVGQNWIVDTGLSGGERLILDGMTNARAGTQVRTVPAENWNERELGKAGRVAE